MADPPVLLVHGFASSYERNWVEPGWVDLLADAGRQVIGPDLLGHGTAAKPHDPAAYDRMEELLLAELPTEPVDAIGFSMGAGMILRLAVEEPQRFHRLVLGGLGANAFATDGDPEPTARAIETGEVGEGASISAPAFVRFAQAPGNDPLALAACMRRRSKALQPEELKAVSCPVLVVLGDRDFAGPAAPLVEALPHGELVTLAGCDHFGTPKDFRFVDAALKFIGAQPG